MVRFESLFNYRWLILCAFSTPAKVDAIATLASLTQNVTQLQASQGVLLANYCPTGNNKCDENPSKAVSIATIGGILFVACVGIAVGTDVTRESIRIVLNHSKWGFVVGLGCQFGFMPLYALLLNVIFKSNLESTAFYSYEATALGMAIVGCLPGGNTSNLFTWFCGGNVALSILMSLASNLAAIGMLPLLLYLYYELRFSNAADVPSVPYVEMLVPLAITIICVFVGMLIKAKASTETVWWTAKVSSLVALLFLFVSVLLGIAKNPHVITHGSYSMYIFCLTMQPAGYGAGWLFASLARCSLRDKLTIAFETGVQSFTLGLVMAELGFNSEEEVCQFDSRCMKLIHGTDTSDYEFAWSGDGRIKEGTGLGQITLKGFLPGHAGSRATGGCCRHNELIFLDVFKFSAMCSVFYALHAFWMIKVFRKVFPGGYARNKDRWAEEEYEPETKRQKVVVAEGRLEPCCNSVFDREVPPTTVIDLLGQAVSRCGTEWAIAQETQLGPFVKGQTLSKPWPQWTRWSWADYKSDIEKAARAFAHVGLAMNGTVVIYGFNAPEWNISALAAMLVGAKACGIYPTDTVEQVIYKVVHSNASIAVIEDQKKLEYFVKNAEEMACLKAIFMYRATPDIGSIERKSNLLSVYDWSRIQELAAQSVFQAVIPDASQRGDADPRVIGKKDGSEGANNVIKFQDSSASETGLTPGTPCCIVYTSGTTGMPKGVLLSHDNVCFMAQATLRLTRNRIGVEYSQERMLSYLPLSHVAGFQQDIVLPIAVTACTKGFATVYGARAYDLKEGSLKDRLTFVRPTVFIGVPRVWEKFHEGLKAASLKSQQLRGIRAQMPIICCVRKTTAVRWAKAQGLQSAKALQFGGSGSTAAFLGLADALILSKIRAALGLDACKFSATGAAPTMLETLEAFGSYGIQVNELYGMSESSAYGTFSTDARHLWCSCGFVAPGGQLKIFRHGGKDGQSNFECPRAKDLFNPTDEEQGELCMRGRHIMMGYLANPKLGDVHVVDITNKTNESIDDQGWLHTGDMGCKNENGFVRVTGRYKELIITAGGENVAPVPIEDSIKRHCPAVSNVIMIGDKRKYNTCLVTLKAKEDGQRLAADALLIDGVDTVEAARTSSEFKALIQKALDATNKDSKVCPSNASRVQKFGILPVDFSVEGEELTQTLKLRRKVVEAKYVDMIDSLYNETCQA